MRSPCSSKHFLSTIPTCPAEGPWLRVSRIIERYFGTSREYRSNESSSRSKAAIIRVIRSSIVYRTPTLVVFCRADRIEIRRPFQLYSLPGPILAAPRYLAIRSPFSRPNWLASRPLLRSCAIVNDLIAKMTFCQKCEVTARGATPRLRTLMSMAHRFKRRHLTSEDVGSEQNGSTASSEADAEIRDS